MKAASRSNDGEGGEPHDNVHSDHLHPSRGAVEDDEQDYQRESRDHGHGEEAVRKGEHSATFARLIRHLSDHEVTLSLVGNSAAIELGSKSSISLVKVYVRLKQLAVSDACQVVPGAKPLAEVTQPLNTLNRPRAPTDFKETADIFDIVSLMRALVTVGEGLDHELEHFRTWKHQ